MNGTRLGIFHFIESNNWIHNTEGMISPIKSIFGGAISGASGAFIASPFYLVMISSNSSKTMFSLNLTADFIPYRLKLNFRVKLINQ